MKASGLGLNVILNSEREDWILECIQGGMGVSVIPISSATSRGIANRPVSEVKSKRMLEMVVTKEAAAMPELATIQELARTFDWN